MSQAGTEPQYEGAESSSHNEPTIRTCSLEVAAETFKIKNVPDGYRKTGSPQVKMALNDPHL